MTNETNIKRKFKNSIKRGTGEAVLLMRHHLDLDFSTEIIEASLKNFAYDEQLESSRAPYLFELISLSDKRESIREAVLEGLTKEQKDTWSLTQLFDLAKLFAMQGDKEAKDAIYNGFVNNPIYHANWAGSYEIVDLDGFEVLKFIVEKYGKDLQNDPDDWQDDAIIKYFEDANPDLNIFEMLEKAAIYNSYIKTYLGAVSENTEARQSRKKETIVYDNIIDDLLSREKKFLHKLNLTETELKSIASRLKAEKDEHKLEKLLNVFRKYKYPLESEFILELTIHKKQTIVKLAIDAMQYLSSDAIRDFALVSIRKGKYPDCAARILKSNYQAGDAKLLTEVLKRYRGEDMIEAFTATYIDIYSSNQTTECKGPLEAIYNKSNCGIHRKDVIKILIDNNVLSDQIVQELQFDCNDEIRTLYNNLFTQ